MEFLDKMKNWGINILIGIPVVGVSCVLGWWATKGTVDIIEKISVNIISILLPLLVLQTTLMIQLLNELHRYAEKHEQVNFNQVIKSIRRNFVDEIVIIFITIIVLIGKEYCKSSHACDCVVWSWVINYSQIIANSFVIFTILYFMWVIIDEVGGFLKLFVENNKPQS